MLASSMYFPCWRLNLTSLPIYSPWSGLLGHGHMLHVCLQHLVFIGAELEGKGTAAWDDNLGWVHGLEFPQRQ